MRMWGKGPMEPVHFINTLDPSCTFVYEGGDVVMLPSALVLLNIRVGYGVELSSCITRRPYFRCNIEKLFPHRVLLYIWFHTLAKTSLKSSVIDLGLVDKGFICRRSRDFSNCHLGCDAV
jgi:hypothetical protein